MIESRELDKTSKQELSSLSSLRSITPPNEQGKKKTFRNMQN